MTALGRAHASATPQWNRHSVVTTEQQIWGVDLSFSPLTGLSFRVYFLFFNQLLFGETEYIYAYAECVPDHFQNSINSAVIHIRQISRKINPVAF